MLRPVTTSPVTLMASPHADVDAEDEHEVHVGPLPTVVAAGLDDGAPRLLYGLQLELLQPSPTCVKFGLRNLAVKCWNE